MTSSALETFTNWLRLRLGIDEVDEKKLDALEQEILHHPLVHDLDAVRLGTLVAARLEQGVQANSAHIEARERLLIFLAGRPHLDDHHQALVNLLSRDTPQ